MSDEPLEEELRTAILYLLQISAEWLNETWLGRPEFGGKRKVNFESFLKKFTAMTLEHRDKRAEWVDEVRTVALADVMVSEAERVREALKQGADRAELVRQAVDHVLSAGKTYSFVLYRNEVTSTLETSLNHKQRGMSLRDFVTGELLGILPNAPQKRTVQNVRRALGGDEAPGGVSNKEIAERLVGDVPPLPHEVRRLVEEILARADRLNHGRLTPASTGPQDGDAQFAATVANPSHSVERKCPPQMATSNDEGSASTEDPPRSHRDSGVPPKRAND